MFVRRHIDNVEVSTVHGNALLFFMSCRLGLIKGRLGQRAGRMADWTWFAGTVVALVELSMERSLVRNMMQEGMIPLWRARIVMTCVFAKSNLVSMLRTWSFRRDWSTRLDRK